MKMLLCVVAMLVAGFTLPAQAHSRHHHHFRHFRARHHAKAAHGRHFRPAIDLDRASAPSRSMIVSMRHYLGSRNPTGFRGPWCGAMMALVARRDGVHVPRNPNLAANWAHAGPRIARPVPGAIAVFAHHVGLIERVVGRIIYLISGNHSHRVAEGSYQARRAIAFIAPQRG
jgi:uncharacterized protein (TIGR02594 family)